jgi:hypothetical protein
MPDSSLDVLRRRQGEGPREVLRAYVAANAVPLVIGIALHLLTEIPAAHVYGHITLGLVWGVLQFCIFAVGVWVYETRSTRLSAPRRADLRLR